jgi:hypothetical protein
MKNKSSKLDTKEKSLFKQIAGKVRGYEFPQMFLTAIVVCQILVLFLIFKSELIEFLSPLKNPYPLYIAFITLFIFAVLFEFKKNHPRYSLNRALINAYFYTFGVFIAASIHPFFHQIILEGAIESQKEFAESGLGYLNLDEYYRLFQNPLFGFGAIIAILFTIQRIMFTGIFHRIFEAAFIKQSHRIVECTPEVQKLFLKLQTEAEKELTKLDALKIKALERNENHKVEIYLSQARIHSLYKKRISEILRQETL